MLDEVIQEVRDRASIVEVVGSRIKLKKAGASYKACCPFHAETTPSFIISPAKGEIATCFGGCGTYDPIGFVMQYHSIEFIDAVKMLAGELGIAVPEQRQYTPQQTQQRAVAKQAKLDMLTVLNTATQYYEQQLATSAEAQAYLASRGFSQADVAVLRAFRVGYAPNGYHNLAGAFADYNAALPFLRECGLVKESEGGKLYDAFRGRIVLPLLDKVGAPIAYSSRIIDSGNKQVAKYMNSPEYALFKKGEVLYGLYQALPNIRRGVAPLLVEGNLDTITLHRYGFNSAVASQGTAITAVQLSLLFAVAQSHVVVMLDADAAGRKAALKVLDTALEAGLITDVKSLKFVFLPDGEAKDPDAYLRIHGAASLQAQIDAAMTLTSTLVARVRHEVGDAALAGAEGKAQFLLKLKPSFAHLAKSAPLTATMLEHELAGLLGVDLATVGELLRGQRRTTKAAAAKRFTAHSNSTVGAAYYAPTIPAPEPVKVPSIYVRPLELVYRMLYASPRLAQAYVFDEAFTYEGLSPAAVKLLRTIDYMAQHCDSPSDVPDGALGVPRLAATALGGVMPDADFARLVQAVVALECA